MIRIACCLETTLSADPSSVDEEARVLDLRSEIAVEQALRISERIEASVSAFCVGGEGAERALRQVLALGVNEAVQIRFEKPDWRVGQRLMAKAIAHANALDPVHLILLANEASELNRSDAPAILSQLLDWPLLPNADQMEVNEQCVQAWCRFTDYRLLLECPFPAIVSVHPALNTPRLPKLSQILAARKVPLQVLGLEDLGLALDDPLLQPLERRRGIYPASENTSRLIFDDQDPGAAEKFAAVLREQLRAGSGDA